MQVNNSFPNPEITDRLPLALVVNPLHVQACVCVCACVHVCARVCVHVGGVCANTFIAEFSSLIGNNYRGGKNQGTLKSKENILYFHFQQKRYRHESFQPCVFALLRKRFLD